MHTHSTIDCNEKMMTEATYCTYEYSRLHTVAWVETKTSPLTYAELHLFSVASTIFYHSVRTNVDVWTEPRINGENAMLKYCGTTTLPKTPIMGGKHTTSSTVVHLNLGGLLHSQLGHPAGGGGGCKKKGSRHDTQTVCVICVQPKNIYCTVARIHACTHTTLQSLFHHGSEKVNDTSNNHGEIIWDRKLRYPRVEQHWHTVPFLNTITRQFDYVNWTSRCHWQGTLTTPCSLLSVTVWLFRNEAIH